MIMKHFLLTLFVLFAGMHLAKADNSFAYLLGADSINVNLDYSRLQISPDVHVNFPELLDLYGDTWRTGFLREMNASNEEWNLTFGTFNSQYTVLVQFVSLRPNASLKVIFRIIDMHTVSELHAQVVESRGGLFGSFEELLRESIQRVGEEIGDIIKDNIE